MSCPPEKIATEPQVVLRMDAYNAFNHINMGNPGGNIQSAESNGSAMPRQLQSSERLQF